MNFSIQDYEYDNKQRPAAIHIQEPQVYERASLINDRRRELEFLEKKLDDSVNLSFKPSIVRNLEVVRSIGAALNVDADPLGGEILDRESDKADLTNEIELTNLRTQLELQKAQLELAQQSKLAKEDLQASAITVAPNSNQIPEEVSALGQRVSALQGEIDSLKKDLREKSAVTRPVNPTKGANSISSTPLESLRDLQAYRAELRQAIEEARLDDAHDVSSGGLYRLQFHATVLPGKESGQWAMAMLEPKIGTIGAKGYDELYDKWLGYLNERIQSSTSLYQIILGQQSRSQKIDLISLTRLAEDSKLFRIVSVEMVFEQGCSGDDDLVTEPFKIPFARPRDNLVIPKGTMEKVRLEIGSHTSCRIEVLSSKSYQEKGNLTQSFNINATRENKKTEFSKVLEALRENFRVYSVGPLERNDQVASVASVSNALDLAFSYSQKVSGSGLGGMLGTDLNSNVASRHEAIERLPRVVSFSSSKMERSGESESRKSVFGWVFGPKARIAKGGNRLELFHVPEPHKLYADIIVPAWIPSLELTVKTAWISNWNNTGDFEDDATESLFTYAVRVTLPSSLASMTSLTRAISDRYGIGLNLDSPLIQRVDPENVHSCAKDTSFAIYGHNLWRDTEVYLQGKRAKKVRVLPGMRGVVADFSIKEVFDQGLLLANSEQRASLEVFTRHGRDYYDVSILNGAGLGLCTTSKLANQLTMSYAKTYFLLDDPLLLSVKNGTFPSAFSKVDFYARKKGAGISYAKVATNISIGERVITTDGAALTSLSLSGGDSVETYLELYKSPDAVGERIMLSGGVATYPTKPNVSISLSSQSVPSLPVIVYASLPKNLKQAYPAFFGTGAIEGFIATSKGNLSLKVTLRGLETRGANNGKYKVELELKAGAIATWASLPKSEAATIYLKVSDDYVTFNTATIKNN